MSTELLYRDDAYLKSAAARVLEVSERGIELDRTIFYPLGGGQPGDRGTHVRNIAEIGGIRVTRIRSEGKRNRRVEIVLAP